MCTGRTDEFRKDAVRTALISGLSRPQIADDLAVDGMIPVPVNKWVWLAGDVIDMAKALVLWQR